ncbi:MAG: helix-turn-helix domain-containing protein [Rubrobacter sp.]
MKDKEEQHVKAWPFGEDVVLESYRYAPGPAAELPRHSHGGYQIGLSLNFPGEYRYRGASHAVPVGSLSVIHPGEVHSARDPQDRLTPAEYRMMYAKPELLGDAAAEVSRREKASLPFFPNPTILDRDLAWNFLKLHATLEGSASRLEKDSRLLTVLARFIQRHTDTRPSPRLAGEERRAIQQVREYLEDNHACNVSLEELSRLANLSPFHLTRVFSERVGMPPHAYQNQVRVARARELLLRGWPIAQTAFETGFADQSHLTRHFKRLVGVAPGSYARNSKNVQGSNPQGR